MHTLTKKIREKAKVAIREEEEKKEGKKGGQYAKAHERGMNMFKLNIFCITYDTDNAYPTATKLPTVTAANALR